MSRRRIKSNGAAKKKKGQPGKNSEHYRRAQKLRALEMMRSHNNLRRQIMDAKEKEAAAEAARVKANVEMVCAEDMGTAAEVPDSDSEE